jgi:hypothetical protein
MVQSKKKTIFSDFDNFSTYCNKYFVENRAIHEPVDSEDVTDN